MIRGRAVGHREEEFDCRRATPSHCWAVSTSKDKYDLIRMGHRQSDLPTVLTLETQYLVTGKTPDLLRSSLYLLLRSSLLIYSTLLFLQYLTSSAMLSPVFSSFLLMSSTGSDSMFEGREGLPPVFQHQPQIDGLGVPTPLIKTVDLLVVQVDQFRTKEVIVCITLQCPRSNQSLELVVHHRCDLLEDYRMVDLEDLEQLAQDR